MSEISAGLLVFCLLAAVTVGSAVLVAFSRSIIYSAFSLMGTLLGLAGLYVTLAADFVAVVQVLVYVGGILVLTLFAVMLTHRISDVEISNRALGRFPAILVVGLVAAVMVRAVLGAGWKVRELLPPVPTTYGVGNAFLGEYVLPFELASVVLLAALVGAVVLSRKELKE
ncbi:MAG: NADH-quinone oxidoreductase subunit J [Candidatus Binatia bacterium]|nr:MAG: NADH-quinone oxidoreductase subunit J [Candidatus Binatia bacterium]